MPGAAALHALRIALKRLRYGLEFFHPLGDRKALKRLLTRIGELQDDLGYLHDLAQAQGRLRELAGLHGELREAAAFVAGWHGPRALLLQAELPRRAQRVLAKRLPVRKARSSS